MRLFSTGTMLVAATASVVSLCAFRSPQPEPSVYLAPPVSLTAQWCGDVSSYLVHKDTRDMDNALTASESLPWKYTGEDTANVYYDTRDGDKKYLKGDLSDLRLDFTAQCSFTGMVGHNPQVAQ
jgi:hypothetical protein